MSGSSFDIERARLEAASHGLGRGHFDEFQRLAKTVAYAAPFQFLVIDCPDEALRDRLIAALDAVGKAAGLRSVRQPLSRIKDAAALEVRLVRQAARHELIHLVGGAVWFDAARWDALNARRERLAETARARLLFWLDAPSIALAMRHATDLWAWRSGVYTFDAAADTGLSSLPEEVVDRTFVDTRSMSERHRRIATLREWLAATPPPPAELQGALLDELGSLLYSTGDIEAALVHWRDVERPFYLQHGDRRAATVVVSQIADVLQLRGDFEGALQLRREEELPVFRAEGDERSFAIALGKIADVLEMRGDYDEVLRIRREEELPLYERLGERRLGAIVKSKIAGLLRLRGQADEALRLLREEVLPVYERLGDVRERAGAMARVAELLRLKGQNEEALRILRQEVLPVYERLGDVRSRAITLGEIAETLQYRGQIDEALRIRMEQELPVYEEMGDLHSLAVGQAQVADLLLQRGDFDAALSLRRDKVLPFYERVGDRRGVGISKARIAQALIRRDGHAGAQASGLLREALATARALQLADVPGIEAFMRSVGIDPDPTSL